MAARKSGACAFCESSLQKGPKRNASSGSGFFARVWAVVAGIPPGKVMTYGQIASFLGDGYSARYVGFAMSAAPQSSQLPCHRVLNRLGEMAPGPIFGGQDAQRRLLEKEGVSFTAKGRVDLALCLFQPELYSK